MMTSALPQTRKEQAQLIEQKREKEVDKLIENWSHWARGGLSPSVEAVEYLLEEPRPTVNIESAEEMETVITRLKKDRPGLWDYVKAHYLARLTNKEGARRLDLSVTIYKDRRGRLLAWVDARLQRK